MARPEEVRHFLRRCNSRFRDFHVHEDATDRANLLLSWRTYPSHNSVVPIRQDDWQVRTLLWSWMCVVTTNGLSFFSPPYFAFALLSVLLPPWCALCTVSFSGALAWGRLSRSDNWTCASAARLRQSSRRRCTDDCFKMTSPTFILRNLHCRGALSSQCMTRMVGAQGVNCCGQWTADTS